MVRYFTFAQLLLFYFASSSLAMDKDLDPTSQEDLAHGIQNLTLYARETEPLPQKVPEPRRKSSLNVLIADDNDMNLKILTRCLTKLGDTVEAVHNGLEALEVMKRDGQNFNVLISDGEMPVMDGPTAVGEIAMLDIKIPMFILTGNTTEDYHNQCMKKGVQAVLHRPITNQVLKDILDPFRQPQPEEVHIQGEPEPRPKPDEAETDQPNYREH